MKQLKDIVSDVLGKIKKEKLVSEDELMAVWQEVSGRVGVEHSKPVSLHRETLRVLVQNSSWVHELTINKRKILRGLQKRFGRDKIRDIRFKIGEFK